MAENVLKISTQEKASELNQGAFFDLNKNNEILTSLIFLLHNYIKNIKNLQHS